MFGVLVGEGRTSASRWFVAATSHSGMGMGDHIIRLHHQFTLHQEAARLNYGGSRQIEQNCTLHTCEIHLQNCGNHKHIYEGNLSSTLNTHGGNFR